MCTALFFFLNNYFKALQWKTVCRAVGYRQNHYSKSVLSKKISQELKEKCTYKIITDDSGLVLWWRQRCMALCEKTGNMPKLLLQEGNLSKPGCSGIANTTGEIRESDSACNYC